MLASTLSLQPGWSPYNVTLSAAVQHLRRASSHSSQTSFIPFRALIRIWTKVWHFSAVHRVLYCALQNSCESLATESAESQTPPKIGEQRGFRLLSSLQLNTLVLLHVAHALIIHSIMVGQPYDYRTNASIELLLKCNIPPKSIVENLQPSLSQIYRKKQRFKVFGKVNFLSLIGAGRPRLLTIEYEKTVMDFLDEYSEIYFNEHRSEL
jgi:hypothetical protein